MTFALFLQQSFVSDNIDFCYPGYYMLDAAGSKTEQMVF